MSRETDLPRNSAAPTLGRRERNKLYKAQRIKEAVRTLFQERGFDDATMRAIALRAGVGLGTLFSYASNKRDLLFLTYVEDQERLLAAAFSAAQAGTLLDRLVRVFEPFYRFFARQPAIARLLLRELVFYVQGAQAARFQDGRRRIVDGVERMIVDARAQGRIGSREECRTVARLIFAVYQAEVRRWLLAERPRPSEGLARLRRVLRLLIRGLEPGKGAL